MKTKNRVVRTVTRLRWILNEKTAPPVVALGVMLVVILLTLAFNVFLKADEGVTTTTDTTTAPALQITTADGVILAAELIYPAGAGPFPVVILVHEFGQDRTQWAPYREEFLAEGFAVLSYDTRGFGESTLAAIPAANAAYFSSMPNDLAAVVEYALDQPKINSQKIFVIGASLGGNIALVEAGRNSSITRTVILSPSGTSSLDGTGLTDFTPKSILGIADSADQPALTTIMDKVAEPKKTIIVPATGHGVALLQHRTVIEAILQWLTQ